MTPLRPSIFRSRFFWNLYLTYALLVVATSAAIGFIVDHQMEGALLSDVETSLRDKTVLLSTYAAEAFAVKGNYNLARLGAESRSRITLILPDGRVLADSERPATEMENHLNRPEVQEALHAPFGFSHRLSATTGYWQYYAARAVRSGNQLQGIVRVSIPLETVAARLGVLRASIAGAAGIGVLAALLLGVVAGHRLTRPIYQEQAQLRSMVGGIPVGLLAIDGGDRVLFANRAACQMLGANEEQIVGQKLEEIAGGTSGESVLPNLAARVRENEREGSAEIVEAEISMPRSSQEVVVSANASRFEGGGPSSVVVVLEDITSLKRLERIRRDFVANVSHEIKTPLTSIKGYVETLLGGALFDEQNNVRFLKKVEDHVGRLTNLVQDLLSLARIEATEGSLRVSETDWRPVVEGAVRRYERALQSRGLTCTTEIDAVDCVVMGDAEAMTQVLDNLLDNAIKYTPPPGGLTVRLYRNHANVSLSVADTGIGIPSGDMERIFERFYRVDKARSREMGGTGLGLAIVKHLIQAMHGEVRVESEAGKGSEFTVTLPAARA